MDGKPIECREMLKNDTVSKDASSHMVILHGRGTMPRVGLNPAKRSIQGHPHKTSKNPRSDSKLTRAPETRLERLERLTKLGQRALVERRDQMSGPPELAEKVGMTTVGQGHHAAGEG